MSRPMDQERIQERIEDLLSWLGVKRKNPFYEDCVQEAWLSILCMDKRKYKNPVYQVQAAKWAVLGYLKKERAEAGKNLAFQAGATPEEVVIQAMDREREIKAIVAALEPREVFVYVLAECSPLSQNQVGQLLGLSPRTVRRMLRTAREKVTRVASADAPVSAGSVCG